MFKDLRVLIRSFPTRTKWGLVCVVFAQFLTSVLDLLGLGLVLPLMQVVTGGDVSSGSYLEVVSDFFGDPGRGTLIVYLGLAMMSAFTVKTGLGLLLQWVSLGIVNRMNAYTSVRLLASFLQEDFLVHRHRKTADLIRAVGVSVAQALTSVLGSTLSATSHLLSIVLILGFLLITVPVPTAIAIVYFGLAVVLLQRLLAGPNRRAGLASNHASWRASQAMHDSMQGFRDIRMHDAEPFFLSRYSTHTGLHAEAARKANFLSQLPKQLLELATVGGLAALLVAVGLNTGDATAVTPYLALFVAAALRLLPVIVALTANLGTISFGREGLQLTAQSLSELQAPSAAAPDTNRRRLDGRALPPGELEISNVDFTYPDGTHPVLTGIDLSVPSGGSLALAGVSGSGKTTLVDIVLGLIDPTLGEVRYAGQPIRELDAKWRANVAYVPPDVFILDTTLRENIAFAVDGEDVDEALLNDSISQAQLKDVVKNLPQGLDTLVGERGQRLSGGQRQRLGIARALYRRPHVIVLDEATSALDNETERRISETVTSLRGRVTTIVVAHRLSTIRNVDQVAFLEEGRVAAVGTFDEVAQQSTTFANLVRLGRLE